MELNEDFDIVSPSRTVEALRDSGYRDTAHALAELIDNSIESDASLVEVFVTEVSNDTAHQTRWQVDQIAVLDNGSGMEDVVLRKALKFGDGTRRQRRGIGRFGMGLPNSSISQSTCVVVHSWQNGCANAVKTFLDLGYISEGHSQVPTPEASPLDSQWVQLSEGISLTGTLVEWTNMDRVTWKTASTTLDKTEVLIGRIYRNFLVAGKVQIRLVVVRDGKVSEERYVKPNDPLFLTANSSTPAPFATVPMFELAGSGTGGLGTWEYSLTGLNGQKFPVVITASVAKKVARVDDEETPIWPVAQRGKEAGSTPWGKRAQLNQGISVVRAGRELFLDPSWLIQYDPTERWWGLEISFDPGLDEVFGVTNNKQGATVFSSMLGYEWKEEAESGEEYQIYLQRLMDEGDERVALIEMMVQIPKIIKVLRQRSKELTRGTRGRAKSDAQRHDEDIKSITKRVTEERKEEGHLSQTDRSGDERTIDEQRAEQLQNLTEENNVPRDEAVEIVDLDLGNSWNSQILDRYQPDNPAFFGIDFLSGMLQINLNTAHPVHPRLLEVLEVGDKELDTEEMKAALLKARDALRLLITAFARYEDEEPEGRSRDRIRDVRQGWGVLARRFFDEGQD